MLILALALAAAPVGAADATPTGWSTLLASVATGARPAAATTTTTTTKAAPRTPAKGCADVNLQPTSANLAQIEATTFCLIEQVRVAHHLRLLRLNLLLQGVAKGQTRDMVAGNYFGDNSISGKTPMQRILATPYPSGAAHVNSAQNIGWATGPLDTPAAMVGAWMSSTPHREIILTPRFRDIGVGVTPAAPSSLSEGLAGATYTLELGQRIFAARSARRAT
jgi:uncharacterized protein YkwD